MIEMNLVKDKISNLGLALYRGPGVASVSQVVFHAVAFYIDGGEATHTVDIAYIDEEGYATNGRFSPEIQAAFIELLNATADHLPESRWAIFEMVVEKSGGFEINIQYPEQTSLSRSENFGMSFFDLICANYFPGVPLRAKNTMAER